MSLYDSVVQHWRAVFPAAAVDQLLAEDGVTIRAELEKAQHLVRERKSQQKFQRWIDGQALAGRDFDEAQLRWLDWMREDITAQGELSVAHLGQGRYAQAGGTDKAARIFGRRTLDEVVASLNATLGSKPSGCGCGGQCGVKSGSGCGCATKPPPAASTSVPEPRLDALLRGELPKTAQEFATYDPLVEQERRADAEPDEAVLHRLMQRIDARIAHGEAERPVVVKLGLDYVEARAEAILLRGAGWDAVPLLLDRPALALTLPSGAAHTMVVAVRDTMGRLAIHPDRTGTLNHLHPVLRTAEETVARLHERIDRPIATRAQLERFAESLWRHAHDEALQRSGRGHRREFEISEHEGRGLSGDP